MEFVWILLYALTAFGFRRFDSGGGCPVPLEPWALLAYGAALLLWLGNSGWGDRFGLNRIRFPESGRHGLWVLLLIPGCNLLLGQKAVLSLSVLAAAMASAIAEEVFFRCFLLRWMEKRWKLGGMILASAVFGLYHLWNLPAAGISVTLLQVVCAFGAGLCYSGAAVCCGSLWIPILAHFLVNLTGWASPIENLTGFTGGALLLCAAVSGVSGIWMYQKHFHITNQ